MAKKKTNISGLSEDLSKSVAKAIEKESKSLVLPLKRKRIGLSVSDSDEYKQLGFSETHQKDITIELTRYLLVNGAHIIYGGDLREGGYTYAFSELTFQYREKEEHNQTYYTNFFGWPIYNKLQNSDEADFKKNKVDIVKVPAPKEVPAHLKNQFVLPNTLEHKALWARSMSLMRTEMVKNTQGRIFIGGKLSTYKGFYPGIIEEGFLTSKAKQPIFLIGAFGGATNLMIRALQGESEKKLVNEVFELFPALQELYKHVGKKPLTNDLNDIFSYFKRLGIPGISQLNGLNKNENEIIFNTQHFPEMIYYVLLGLKRKL